MDDLLEHPDVSSAQRSGHPTFQNGENQDSVESWNAYLDEFQTEIMKWLKDGYQDILKEFSESYAKRYGVPAYIDWLN